MKLSLIACICLFLIAGPTVVSTSPETTAEQEALAQWIRDLTMQGAAEQARAHERGLQLPEGKVVIESLDQLQAPPSVVRHFQRSIEQQRAGVVTTTAGAIPSVEDVLSRTNARVLSMQEIRKRVLGTVSGIDKTRLAQSRVVATDWAGSMTSAGSTGLSRLYLLEGIGTVEFSENNIRRGQGSVRLLKEGLNASVRGAPAVKVMQHSPEGRGRVDIHWVAEDKMLGLQLITNNGSAVERYAELLQQIAEGIDP